MSDTPPNDTDNGQRDRRIAMAAYWLSDAYAPDLSYDTDGNVLVDDSYYEDAEMLLKLLDGVQ